MIKFILSYSYNFLWVAVVIKASLADNKGTYCQRGSWEEDVEDDWRKAFTALTGSTEWVRNNNNNNNNNNNKTYTSILYGLKFLFQNCFVHLQYFFLHPKLLDKWKNNWIFLLSQQKRALK